MKARGFAATLHLQRLDLEPLQLQEPLQVLLQGAHGLGPGGAAALRVEEDRQLPQAPGVEGRRQELGVAVAGSVAAVLRRGSARPREVWGEVVGVDDLGAEVEVRRGAGRAGGGEDGQPLGVREVAGAVGIVFLRLVVSKGLQGGASDVDVGQSLRRSLT